MSTILEKKRKLKMIIDTAKYRERIKVTNEFTRLLEKQKKDFLKLIRDEKRLWDSESRSLENQYRQKMKDEIKIVVENKERELFRLKKEVYQLRKEVRESKKAYLMYREYVDYLRRLSDDLSIGVRKVLLDFSNSYKLIETARDKIEFHEKHVRKIDPQIRKLLGIDIDEELISRDLDGAAADIK